MRHQKPSPPSNGGAEFELNHWRSSPTKHSSLHRRITAPAKLDLGPPSDPNATSAGYTSIRDIIASSPCLSASPGGAAVASASDIQIRNPLVQQAAYAYLQATPSGIEGLHRGKGRWSCLGFIGWVLVTICSKGRRDDEVSFSITNRVGDV